VTTLVFPAAAAKSTARSGDMAAFHNLIIRRAEILGCEPRNRAVVDVCSCAISRSVSLPAAPRCLASFCWCGVSLGLRPSFTPLATARARPFGLCAARHFAEHLLASGLGELADLRLDALAVG
jgi:hypothetical protein